MNQLTISENPSNDDHGGLIEPDEHLFKAASLEDARNKRRQMEVAKRAERRQFRGKSLPDDAA